jgi:hypothetical protein
VYDVFLEYMPHLRDGADTILTPGAPAPGFNQFHLFNVSTDRVRVDMNLLGGFSLRTDFAKLGLQSQFMSLWDFTASAGGPNIVFGLDPTGSMLWYQFGLGWTGFVRANFQLAPGGGSATLTVVKQNPDTSETTTVINLSSTQFRIKGTTSEGMVVQLLGGASTFGLAAAEVPEGEPPASAEEALEQEAPEEELAPSEEQLAATLPANWRSTDVLSFAPPSLLELLASIVTSPESGAAAHPNVNAAGDAELAHMDRAALRADRIAEEMSDASGDGGADFIEALDAVFAAGGDFLA